jgi:F-type H+-transporting ATPase subunit a
MHESHELWLTKLFNEYLAGPANAVLGGAHDLLEKTGVHIDPAHPWANWMAMEVLVVLIVMLLFAVLKPKLSVDNPGKLQHIFESVYLFLRDSAEEVGVHHHMKYVPYFGTLFIFILFMNLIGVIPGFESPTMNPSVPAGCALATFLYYNWQGLRENGAGYLKHFLGPIPALAPIMIPIELVSHLARPLSLTIRLFANMFAGEQVTIAFLGLTYLVGPAIFMGLHVFVSFLQAYIFTLLTMIYVASAVSHEH